MAFFSDDGPLLTFAPATPAQLVAIAATCAAQSAAIAAHAASPLGRARAAWAARNGWAPNAPVFPAGFTFGADPAADLAAYS